MVRRRSHSTRLSSAIGNFALRALILAGLVLAAACAPRIAAEGPEIRLPAIERSESMGVSGDYFVTRDGLRLGLVRWEAEAPFAVIVALHGMSDYSNAFAMPGPFWAQNGITTYAYDQRGFGRSPNRGIWPGSEILRRDLADFVDVVKARHAGLPVFVLGESMGGAVAMTAFTGNPAPKAEGIILVAPAVWSRRTMPISYRVALWTVAHTLPWWTLSGRGLNIMPSDNIAMLRAISRDPLFQKETRADAVYGLVTLMDEAYEAPPRLNGIPLLVVYGGNDQIIPKAPTEQMIARLNGNAVVKRYPEGYHMLLRDLDGEERWADIALWVRAQARLFAGASALAMR